MSEQLSRLERLSQREREVLALRAAGISQREIARTLSVEPRTVKFHLGNITSSWGSRRRARDPASCSFRGSLPIYRRKEATRWRA